MAKVLVVVFDVSFSSSVQVEEGFELRWRLLVLWFAFSFALRSRGRAWWRFRSFSG